MNNRRKLLIALGMGAIAMPFGCFAQTPAPGMHRIGFLGITSAADTEMRLDALRVGLRNLGYVEGKNIAIEYRFADGKYERLAELAAELAKIAVEVIVTYSNIGARAAKQATTTIPIVVATSADLVTTDIVASLARPGGNVTGLSRFTQEMGLKQLEMLKETLPRIKRVAYPINAVVQLNSSTDIGSAFMDKNCVYSDTDPVYTDTAIFSRQLCRRIQS